jgi:mannose-6-phosphate isomerase-like protein (cupin superfamily)
MPVSDQTLREVAILNGEYNVGVSVAHRAMPPGHTPGAFAGGPIEHSDITEIYEILSGNATLVTGGTIENPKVHVQIIHAGPGPSVSGTGVENGVTREVGPGDVVIIPPNTPHFFSHIDSEVTYLIFRVDTHHIWTMPYKPHQYKSHQKD